ncbi:N-acetyltransferase [Phenylobacterium sp. Root700]|uniref:GNAT family N-acetyltransferase n=1 Tax=Phenylobacterium sp. Root700 TaxID=1736591 RepID=UPI0006F71BA6|nr:GNAT family N-acetyltransferase [Phenylobacterium sp. Root700]KRB42957.1 hypothetical protein ASE02_20725 [Phenylobacterium sp. Root700]
MTTVSSRDYAGPADLRAMQVLAQRLWSRASYHHVGDLAWQRFEHLGREPAWRTRIWRDGEAVVGWAWLVEAGHFYFQVDPAYSVLFDEVFDWIEAASDASALSTGVLENQPDLIAALQRRGYQAGSDAYPFNLKTARTLERLPPLVLPEGYRAASMAELGDPDARALAHRNAWSRIAGREDMPPSLSRVTGESYRNVMAAWPYRSDLDWAIVAPDGRWAANCCIWLDGANQVGELEPVGTDADFRRLGLGRGVCIAALHALRETGADQAIVTCRGDEAYPAPRKLYFELGFETYTRSYVYRRKRLA